VAIVIKMSDDEVAKSEKTALSDYLDNIRTIVVENNKELNNTYYDELQQECAIEYARDHC
jgi:hypothetical protein